VDGLLARTGARREALGGGVRLIDQPVEALSDELPCLLDGATLAVDCMGWTRHIEAQKDPNYDLKLNLASHFAVIAALARRRPLLVIYLGTRHQYGRVDAEVIVEDTPFQPTDVQGIHKAAADHHYRLAAERLGVTVAALRFGNTFGPGQPMEGDDIGLVGGFLRTLLAGGTIDVFTGNRTRNLIYGPDLAWTVEALACQSLTGFQPFNLAGANISVVELARLLVDRVGMGCLIEKPLPADIAAGEIGNAHLDDSRLTAVIGPPHTTPLATAVTATIAYVRRRATLAASN
jgi:nucleoside-diphosphate-sugar epimerase